MQITETQQTQYMINLPSLLVIGFIIAIILVYIGQRKGKDNPSYYTLIGTGIVLLGIMVVIVPLLWYGYWALLRTRIEMTFSDILFLSYLSTFGGIIIGYGLVFAFSRRKRPEVSSW